VVIERKGCVLGYRRKRLSNERFGAAKKAEANGTWDPESGERFPFHEDDLKYKHMKVKNKESSSAVIFFLMDVSGSMDKNKKYIARSFYFLLYQFLRYKYENIEVVFISHSTDAKEVTEEEFFQKATTGGTIMSSALELEKEIISKRYHPSSWNIYTFYTGDGENWTTDNNKTVKLLNELKEINQMICYAEINPFRNPEYDADFGRNFGYSPDADPNSLWSRLLPHLSDKFKAVKLMSPKHIWPSFQKIFGGITP